MSDSTVTGSVPQDSPHFRHQLQVQVLTCASDQPALNLSSYNLLLGFDDLLEWFPKPRKTSCISQIIIKDADEQPDEKMHRAHRVRTGRVPNTGASVLVELGCTIFLYVGVIPSAEAPQSLYFRDFYGRFIM